MNYDQQIAKALNSKHSDTQAVIRSGKKGAKRRTNRRRRQMETRADQLLKQENAGITDEWYEED